MYVYIFNLAFWFGFIWSSLFCHFYVIDLEVGLNLLIHLWEILNYISKKVYDHVILLLKICFDFP